MSSLIRLAFVAGSFLLGFFSDAAPTPLEWTMVNVNATDSQADAHLLRFPDGELDLIDVADGSKLLLDYLHIHHINSIDQVIITHPHKDHYGGLKVLVEGKIKIKKIFMNLPDRSLCDEEKPWGCDYSDVQSTVQILNTHHVPMYSVKAGKIFHNASTGKLEVLFAYDGIHTPVGRTDINGMSLIIRLSYGKTRVLFTGDLNKPIGEYLSGRKEVRADLLKVPHHGTESVAPNSFFDRVAPKMAFVPSPRTLWLSERSKRIREYFEKKGIPTYVNGLDGNVTISFDENGYRVKADARTPSVGPG